MRNSSLPRLICLVGPTAAGKTEAGILLARQYQGAVISADSRQVYAGMNIGTSKPDLKQDQNQPHDILTADNVNGTKHYLFNIKQPDNQLTLAGWQEAAYQVIDYLVSHKTVPFLVGGTMLYMDSVVLNYSLPLVPANKDLRAKLERLPTSDLYRQLISLDPNAQSFIQPHNKRRVIRALEVNQATGHPFSQQRQQGHPRYHSTWIGLFPGWDNLRQRIEHVNQRMLRHGLLREVQRLRRQYGADLPLLQTMNYQQAGAVLDGKLTVKAATTTMNQVNLRYAHRQMSWWKNRPEIKWFTSPHQVIKYAGNKFPRHFYR